MSESHASLPQPVSFTDEGLAHAKAGIARLVQAQYGQLLNAKNIGLECSVGTDLEPVLQVTFSPLTSMISEERAALFAQSMRDVYKHCYSKAVISGDAKLPEIKVTGSGCRFHFNDPAHLRQFMAALQQFMPAPRPSTAICGSVTLDSVPCKAGAERFA